MPPKKSCEFALVRWMQSGEINIISCDAMKSVDRKEGAITKLLWQDKERKTKEWHKVKILKINSKYQLYG